VIFKAKIGFSVDLQVLVASLTSADPAPITTPKPSGSILLNVPLNSKIIHVGKAQILSNAITEQSGTGLLDSNLQFFDSEPTCVGRKQRCRDISGLSVCLCGERVREGDVDSIKCHRNGCETIWVSCCIDFSCSRLKRLSIIFDALSMMM